MEIIKVENVSYRYKSYDSKPVDALKNVSFSVNEGEFLALVGACVYFYECVSIRQKDTGANDRGKMFIQSKKASAADKPKTPEAQPEPAAKTNPLGWILPLCAAVLSFGVWFLHPVSDLYYYGAAILSMAAILVSFISIIHAYNLLSTRRLPQFDKQGGDDRA